MGSFIGIELPFYTYGILMGIAFLLGIWLFKFNSRNSLLPRPPFIDLILVLSICGVVGARINYILLFPQYYHSIRDCLAIHEGGLVFYGGFILAILGLLVYCRLKNYSFAMVADYLIPSLALGHAMGRVGCLINDCCYGCVTDAIKIYHLKKDPAGCFRHPTQLYEIIYLIILAVISIFVLRSNWQEKPKNRGCVAALYFISYSLLRFGNEYLRADPRGGFFTALHLSPAQITSLIVLICGILWIINIKRKNHNVDCGEINNG